ncbi:YoaK family protein [Myroides ceti]|uniref:YoaK family protein n=1 Tax=Paenimyroides ceti TaxID=395087 RepID=A0ABT8CU66_9FLAO|nr:YoaK family protein [Paenimyroides ceti]MDN3708049.1 YoaK family protein [Paenimyroides ceti]
MLRHIGKLRTFEHNLKLASMLSFVAGIVNVSGLLALRVLTTNVTGHFAYFSEEMTFKNYAAALVYLLYIISFLIGAFMCNVMIQLVYRKNKKFTFAVPMLVEVLILVAVGFIVTKTDGLQLKEITACVLLFAMGLQNALVTQVSKSVVRTTHLTGLFTDLGIDLSQLIWVQKGMEQKKVVKSIYLKLAIILCFFLGCTTSGILFNQFYLKTLFIGALVLLAALYYDYILFQYYLLKRMLGHRLKK